MKKILATILTLALLLSVALPIGTVADTGAVTDKPFYALAWDKVDMEKFGNIEDAPVITVKNIGGNLVLSYGSTDPEEIAEKLKKVLDALPEGMRHIRLFKTSEALTVDADLVIYADGGVIQLRKQFEAFIEAYYALGGKLDGVIIDTEYVQMGSWYLYCDPYGGHYANKAPAGSNRNLYHDIVNHPQYQTDVRPLLVEAGFKFYENVGGDRSEIWSMYPPQTIKQVLKGDALAEHLEKYTGCYEIWNRVMNNRQARYFNYALYEPLRARYPDAVLSDYQVTDNVTWYKNLGGYCNADKIGNVSNSNDYSHAPNSSYFVKDGEYLYQNPAGYNSVSYDDDPYGMLMWNINKFKSMYEATDTKKISVWISRYDYSSRSGSYSGNTAYYTESLYHYGMLNPQPFLIYMTISEGGGQAGYDERLQYMSEALSELTRVAGFSDRKVIQVPVSWNDGYVLTGMYAGGRNIWRITPDTTDGTTLESFKIQDSDPTFSINGTTITFPGGKIIQDNAVTLGSCGYWVETAKDVTPVVTREDDRYAKNPSYLEDYESYAADTVLTSSNVALPQTWKITADQNLLITEQNGNKALALTGTAELQNVKLPQNVTAGDHYAMQQAWEISVTLTEKMNSDGKVVLLSTTLDGGVKLADGKIYYDENGQYQELNGVELTAGKKYTFRREMNFANYTGTYSVYADGTLVKRIADVRMRAIVPPINAINISCNKLTTTVLIDDYKLYPLGLSHALEVYDGWGGEKLVATELNAKNNVGYRLSWMNATAERKSYQVKAAYYDSNDALLSESVVATVEMEAFSDGYIAGIVKNQGKKIKLYLADLAGRPAEPQPTVPVTEPSVAPTDPTDPTNATNATNPTTTNKSGDNTTLWIILAVVTVVGVGAVMLVLATTKKKK